MLPPISTELVRVLTARALPQALSAITALELAVEAEFAALAHGHRDRWLQAIAELQILGGAAHVQLDSDVPRFGQERYSDEELARLRLALERLGPWRKGPFQIGPLQIDAEWRSDFKWARFADSLAWSGARVLDVGSGNGYACLRAIGAGAAEVLGIDPTWLYVMQFQALACFLPRIPVGVVPLPLERLPASVCDFDIVMSMGVLYHRRSPLDHLSELKQRLRRGGTLVLESLVVEGAKGYALVPDDRYAAMKNVWFLPSIPTLTAWLERVGFIGVQCIAEATTTALEQRATPWMPSQSLVDFLDPNDSSRTIEGHPAPRRAIWLARRP